MPGIEATPRYALDEIERRWLVDASKVQGLSTQPYRLYEDLYITDSRLRLRRITEPNGTTVYKLGKKYGKRSALSEPITTLYLEKTEYDRLRGMEGHVSVKRRYATSGGSLDIYEVPKPGLMIFEIEFESEGAAVAYRPRRSSLTRSQVLQNIRALGWLFHEFRSSLRPQSPNSALQRAAIGIKCSAAGGRAKSAHERWRARVLSGQRAVAELGS